MGMHGRLLITAVVVVGPSHARGRTRQLARVRPRGHHPAGTRPMADHALITSHLAVLADRLPAEAVNELADGLEETFQHHLRRGLSRADAAAAAVAEFGRPEQVT